MIKHIKRFFRWLHWLGYCFFPISLQAQSLTLEEAYHQARINYPLARQKDLIGKSKAYSLDNAAKGYWPQFSISGQATYQSEVTQVPIQLPGQDIPVLDKDQYKAYAEMNQLIYDGGAIGMQREAIRADAAVKEQKLEVELYKLRERVAQLYFGMLLIDEQLKQNALSQKDIRSGISKAEAAYANGTAFKSNVDVLKAELLKMEQRSVELAAGRKAYLGMLGLFLNHELPEETVLQPPAVPLSTPDINRPELFLYDRMNSSLQVQEQLLYVRNRPKVNLFAQAGWGKPGLNMLDNSFRNYAIGGIRFSWSLGGWYTQKNDKARIGLERNDLQLQREAFLFNTQYSLKQQDAEVAKLRELLGSDEEIIQLRNNIKNAAAAQLENGVIDTNDYLREVNAEDQARQSKAIHSIQLLMAQYNRQVTTGN
jgi:outer membrane protein TolC